MRRLSKAGFPHEFTRTAILPDWWTEECARDPRLLQDIEIRIARFLRCPLEAVCDPTRALAPSRYDGARLRRARNAGSQRLMPAIHAALEIASAVVRNLRAPFAVSDPLPQDPCEWRAQILSTSPALELRDMLAHLWERGIPVVPVGTSPSPSFQGMACIVEQRPVILIQHGHDAPARVAFTVAHEAGHIAARDCEERQPVVDEEDEIVDDSPTERRADEYAARVLMGDHEGLPISGGPSSVHDLAKHALRVEQDHQVDASYLLLDWAHRTGNYQTAMRGIRALYRHIGARQTLFRFFDDAVNVEAASETDQNLLACIGSRPERRATAI